MTKEQLTVTIEKDLLSSIWSYKKRNYPYLSKSAMIEILLAEAMREWRKDLSVVR